MSENEKKKKAADKDEDWAVLPFDEAEDDARWAKLTQEMDELIEKTESTEKLTGTILMEEDLSRFVTEKSQIDGDDSAEEESF